ncbi:MAG: hypothetical protein ACFFAB_11610 [Candidatus Heimdallarchaeota archaeon]
MIEDPSKNKIEELKSELRAKNKEISDYLDKIDHLENIIMEFEASLSEKSDNHDLSLSKIQLKDLEKTNQELKKKLSFLRLENIKLKQELEKIKKGYFDSTSLIQVVDTKLNSDKSETVFEKDIKIEEDHKSSEEIFKNIQIKCPKCETLRSLKIPIKIISQTQNLTTISIPKGMICGHSFQILIDKYFAIKRYHVVDHDFHKLEYYQNIDEVKLQEKDEDLSYFTSFPFYQDVINIFRESIDDRDILGIAIFTEKGKVIYASIPSNLLFNIIKEFEVRMEKRLQDITKMYIEVKHHQKIFLEYIEILNKKIILVIIFSKKVNFGMGTMIFKELKKKVKILTENYKEGAI